MPKPRTYRFRLLIGVLSLLAPALAAIGLIVGLLVFHLRAMGPHTAQTWLIATAAVGAFALLVLVIGRLAGWVGWRWVAMLALPACAPLAAAGIAATWLQAHPSNAEVATNISDPPPLNGKVVPALKGAGHVQTVVVKLPPAAAFDQVKALAAAQPGWRITAQNAPMVIQGTAVFGRFGYRRDWVLRLRPELEGGSLVDMRLRSKPGEPDFGDNAKAVKAFLGQVAVDIG